MIDYTPVVEVIELEPSYNGFYFDDLYPSYIPLPFSTPARVRSRVDGSWHTIVYEFSVLTPSQGVWSESSMEMLPFSNNRVWAFIPTYIDGEKLDLQELSSSVGICYYGYTDMIFSAPDFWENTITMPQTGTYLRATSSMVSDSGLTYNPFGVSLTPFTGYNWFEFLANLGKMLVYDSGFSDILSVDIGGYNIIVILLSGGFVAYMGWCLLKWVIPS